MFPIATAACLGLPLGLAAAARAASPLAEIRLAEIRFAKTAIAAPESLAKERSLALSHLVALLLGWKPSPAPPWTCRYRLGGRTLPELPSCFICCLRHFSCSGHTNAQSMRGPGGESKTSCRYFKAPLAWTFLADHCFLPLKSHKEPLGCLGGNCQ